MSGEKRPKGILKSSSSFDKEGQPVKSAPEKETKWDEMNILATYHPADKDYGHKKIDEPPTPYYGRLSEGDVDDGKSGDEEEAVNPQNIADGLMKATKPRVFTISESSGDDEDELLTDEERVKRREFAKRRKMHYNEFQAVKLARELIDDDEGEEGTSSGAGTETVGTEAVGNKSRENEASQTVAASDDATTALSEDLNVTSSE